MNTGGYNFIDCFISSIDDLPVPPGMSNKLKINQNYLNTTLSLGTSNSVVDDGWAEDVGGFWDDEIPEVVNQPDIIPEQILVDEISHIKVKIYNLKQI